MNTNLFWGAFNEELEKIASGKAARRAKAAKAGVPVQGPRAEVQPSRSEKQAERETHQEAQKKKFADRKNKLENPSRMSRIMANLKGRWAKAPRAAKWGAGGLAAAAAGGGLYAALRKKSGDNKK